MAFNCMLGEVCPKHNDVENGGCPCWWKMPWENVETGAQTIREGCILSQEMGLPIVQAIVRAAHTASEQSSKVNNNLLGGLQDIGNILLQELPKKMELQNGSQYSGSALLDKEKQNS